MMTKNVIEVGKDEAYKGYEDDLQAACFNWTRYQHHKVLCYHSPNGGKRNGREAAKFKAMGVVPGIPDIIVDHPNGGYHGLRIELKAKGGRLQDSQIKILNKMANAGYLCAVVWSFNSFKKLITDYVNGLYTKDKEEEV